MANYWCSYSKSDHCVSTHGVAAVLKALPWLWFLSTSSIDFFFFFVFYTDILNGVLVFSLSKSQSAVTLNKFLAFFFLPCNTLVKHFKQRNLFAGELLLCYGSLLSTGVLTRLFCVDGNTSLCFSLLKSRNSYRFYRGHWNCSFFSYCNFVRYWNLVDISILSKVLGGPSNVYEVAFTCPELQLFFLLIVFWRGISGHFGK